MKLGIFVTTKCNANCPECAQKPTMISQPGYDMSIEEIEKLVYYSEMSGYVFEEIYITGGEPMLWKNIVKGLRILKAAGIAKKIILFTNGMVSGDVYDEILDFVDMVRITDYGWNAKKVKYWTDKYETTGKVVSYKQNVMYSTPEDPVEGSLPADCNCKMFAYIFGKISLCLTGYSVVLSRLFFRKETDMFFGLELRRHYLKFLMNEDATIKPWCRYCVGNKKIRKNIKRRELL